MPTGRGDGAGATSTALLLMLVIGLGSRCEVGDASPAGPVTARSTSCGLPAAGPCYIGYAFKRLPKLDARGCCEACTAAASCAAWEIRSDQANECVLKDNSHAPVKPGGEGNCSSSGTNGPTPPPPPGPPSPPRPRPTGPQFNDMFHGGAVLQRDAVVSVWGLSSQKSVSLRLDAGACTSEGMAVSLDGPVNASGVWMLWLPPQPAAYNRSLSVVDASGQSTVVVSFGEAILCVGQSNMGMQVGPSVRGFDMDNATAENAASSRYTGKISLHARISQATWAAGSTPARDAPQLDSTTWYPVTPTFIKNFSAVCWLTGRDLFESMGGVVPVGLVVNSMGAHPIESWLGPNELRACGLNTYNHGQNGTMCESNMPLSKIWASTVVPMQPYTFASMVFDQAEADINCNRQAIYPCLQKQLISSYRRQFNSTRMNFVAVQLPGYQVGDNVFYMRLAQEAGVTSVENAAIIATYDDSCAAGKTNGCPHGNVHNVHKQPIGARISGQLHAMLTNDTTAVTQGPVATRATATVLQPGEYRVRVSLTGSGLYMNGTRNCTVPQVDPETGTAQPTCCEGRNFTSDFDVSADNITWSTGFDATVDAPLILANTITAETSDATSISFLVHAPSQPVWVRYTANKAFPQCAVFNREGLPTLPFQLKINS